MALPRILPYERHRRGVFGHFWKGKNWIGSSWDSRKRGLCTTWPSWYSPSFLAALTVAYEVAVKRIPQPAIPNDVLTGAPAQKRGFLREWEDAMSRLAFEVILLKKCPGPHIISFLALTRIGGDLALITFLTSKVGKLKCRTYYPKGSLEGVLEIPAVQFAKLAHAKYRHWVREIFTPPNWCFTRRHKTGGKL
jgi:hypothetical protein